MPLTSAVFVRNAIVNINSSRVRCRYVTIRFTPGHYYFSIHQSQNCLKRPDYIVGAFFKDDNGVTTSLHSKFDKTIVFDFNFLSGI